MQWRAALFVVTIAAAILPIPRTLVERIYTGAFFPAFQTGATTLSNTVPFAFFDVLVVVVLVWWLWQAARDLAAGGRASWSSAILRIGMRTATIAAIAYLGFLMAWGMNYRRVPLAEKLQFDATRVSGKAAIALADQTISRVNALYAPAHAGGWNTAWKVDPTLAEAFARAQHEWGSAARTVPARPKRTLLDSYFRSAGVAGMTDPYFLETLVASDLLPFERPFVVAHEWSHLAGIADEGDANFAGWLTCMRGAPPHQYSGWLFLYSEVTAALDPSHARTAAAKLDDGPRDDLRAIRERLLQHVSPRLSAAGWRVYDQYLKANKIEEGTASYAEVVRLILGTTFADEWSPRLRQSP
jgi:hypothetical protein